MANRVFSKDCFQFRTIVRQLLERTFQNRTHSSFAKSSTSVALESPVKRRSTTSFGDVSLRWLQNDKRDAVRIFQQTQNQRTLFSLDTTGRRLERLIRKIDSRLQLFWNQQDIIFYRNKNYEYLFQLNSSVLTIYGYALDAYGRKIGTKRLVLQQSLEKFTSSNPQLFLETLLANSEDSLLVTVWRDEHDDSQRLAIFDIESWYRGYEDTGNRLTCLSQVLKNIRNVAWFENGNGLLLVLVDEKGTQSLIWKRKLENASKNEWKDIILLQMKEQFGIMDLHKTHDSQYIVAHIHTCRRTDLLLFPSMQTRLGEDLDMKSVNMESKSLVSHGCGWFCVVVLSGSNQLEHRIFLVKDFESKPRNVRLMLPNENCCIQDVFLTKDYISLLCRQNTFLYLYRAEISNLKLFDDTIDEKESLEDVMCEYHPSWKLVSFPLQVDSASFCRQADSWSYLNNQVILSLASPTVPCNLYTADLITGSIELSSKQKPRLPCSSSSCSLEWRRLWTNPNNAFERDAYGNRNPSHSVPYTLVFKNGLVPNGKRPILLESYGCYGEIMDTELSPSLLLLLERGWMLCFAHIRGGGEMGSSWHYAGIQERKLASKVDILSVIQELFNQQWSQPGLILARAFSAGVVPLLNAVFEHPELFSALSLYSPFCCVQDWVKQLKKEEFKTSRDFSEFGDSFSLLCPWEKFNNRFIRIRQSLFPWKIPLSDKDNCQLQQDLRWFKHLPSILFQVKRGDTVAPNWMAYKFVYGYEHTQLCLSPHTFKSSAETRFGVYTWEDAGDHHSPFPAAALAVELAFLRKRLRLI
eukprot:jgi/Galph1/886/GphlegSOOS_G5697.1